MNPEKNSLPIRSARLPAYYKSFHCLAQDCRDNCCGGWRIHFDKKDYLRLRRLDLPPELKEIMEDGGVRRIRGEKASDQIYAEFDLRRRADGYCPFQAPDGLCRIQQACGHEVLPHVCTSYPRRTAYSPAAKEYSLSPSCEGVLQLLWELPDGVEFIEEPLPKAEHRSADVVREENLMRHYGAIRKVMFDILQNRALPLRERMLYLGITVQRLQKEDWIRFDPDRWAQQTVSLMDAGMMRETLEKIPGNRSMFITQNLKVLREIIKDKKEVDWIKEIFEALEVQEKIVPVTDPSGKTDRTVNVRMDSFSQGRYESALAEFEEAFSGREYFFENLMVASALFRTFPSLTSREDLWKSYVSLCNLYSVFRFAAVLGCKGSLTKERLFHIIVMVSRATLHNRNRFQGFREDLFKHDSSTLAHMAILLNE